MNRRLLIFAGALAAGLALGWIATHLERVPEKKFFGPSGEARRNPYLAAQRLVTRMGVPSREITAAPELERLPAHAVMMLPNGRQALTPGQQARLLTWVERGGHLIVEAEYLAVSDPLADALGVRRERAARSGTDAAVVLPHAPAPMDVRGLGTQLRLVAPGRRVRARADAGWGLQVVQIEYGRGLVTVLADLAFAANPAIGAVDNAEFLWQLVRSLPDSRELLVYSRIQRLSLWDWLTDHALPVLIAGALLLVLWLWRIVPRFGPVAADPLPARRRLLDHLRASGRFHWNNKGHGRLAGAAREACLTRLMRAHPGFASVPAGERAAHLARYAGIDEAAAAHLLAAGTPARGAEFIALVRALQQVHARLDRGA